jgi:hypothetical protein
MHEGIFDEGVDMLYGIDIGGNLLKHWHYTNKKGGR